MTAYKIKAVFLPVVAFLLTSVSVAVQKEAQPTQLQGLFDSEEIFEIRLEGDIATLLRDRGDDPSYHLMKLHVQHVDSEELLDLRVRVRGNFRRLNCDTPPLRFNFRRHEVPEESIFSGHPTLKLVVPCKGEEYILREYLIYKLFNLFTDHSFRARLVRLTYHDTGNGQTSKSQYAFFIEHKDVLASRNDASLIERLHLRPQIVDQEAFLRMSVFEYMISNTDWSVQYLHNMVMLFLKEEKIYVAVPYDFDLAGLVSAPYARPAEELKLSSVRDRVYRGYCLDDLSVLEPTFEQFQELKPEIYKMVTENTLVQESYIRFATKFLDEFYDTLNNPRKRSRAFSYPCRSYGTGNVVIKGLRHD